VPFAKVYNPATRFSSWRWPSC